MIHRRPRPIAHDIVTELAGRHGIQSQEESLAARRRIEQYLRSLPNDYRSGSENESDDSEMEWVDEDGLSSYASVRNFLFSHEAFIELRAGLWNLADPTMRSRLESIYSEISDTRIQVLQLQVSHISASLFYSLYLIFQCTEREKWVVAETCSSI